ncbi:DUF1569 domain-containing protein [Leptospira langatensis]|uniref:DUF1569 domain-containing protein n=1 Tax=Leptospira langatensis TaxID=2484983 RepID=A0A5F1ZW66_9LEPT|nr:DUF1569 domain-containing protein [Leptospira langatensis]TGK03071.1 DUF1569 domain-containing protein [Leptospira langatensis]TGL41827.1 DUF1569 domain-containing protein [Leptospira langatensis]
MSDPNFSRKEFIQKAVAVGILTSSATVLGSCSNAPAGIKERGLILSNFSEVGVELEKLLLSKEIIPYGEWNPSQILLHCAQSIYYSIKGYPENKSEIFQNTLGKIAFWNFSRKGKMSHDLNAPIPGADILRADVSIQESVIELQKSISAFSHYTGEFAPHFAYGKLTKQEYELAHAMHIANHLDYVTLS